MFTMVRNLYNFKYKNEEDYYDIKGKITKSLMKTPINGVFIIFGMKTSNSYTNEEELILPPSGTPLAWDLEQLLGCRCGNCVKIKHNLLMKLFMPHEGFCKGIREGKVKQGQIIGYVGQQGCQRSSYYEVILMVKSKFTKITFKGRRKKIKKN